MMQIGAYDIYNALHNAQPSQVAIWIRSEAINPVASLTMLDFVLDVKTTCAGELKEGKTFSVLFAQHSSRIRELGVPTLKVRARNFSKAIFKFVIEGMPLATRIEAEKKLAVCGDDCSYYNGSICMHTKCGCFSKIKTFFETESCPIDKW